MSTNDITGDRLVSKPSTDYAAGYDLIWGKDKKLDKDIRPADYVEGRCIIHEEEEALDE